MMAPWDARWPLRSPMYAPLLEPARLLGATEEGWPDLDDYNRLLQSAPTPVLTHSGKLLRFVAQTGKPAAFDEKYEQRAYLAGEVQTRSENWHDLFNALVWRAFPRAKAAINLLHYRASLDRQPPASGRGTARDVLTLFDESGVVVACAQDELSGLLKQHRWKELFWHRRGDLAAHMRFFVFGHSLYEKALQPYIGLTGKALILPVPSSFLALPLPRQLSELDAMIAEHLLAPGSLHASTGLSPLPLLGVPGWWAENETEEFYENVGYFRPPKHPRQKTDNHVEI